MFEMCLFEDIELRNSVKPQLVRATPGHREYLRIENEALTYFAQDGRFLRDDKKGYFVEGKGYVDCSLVDCVLWWRGADRGKLKQLSLFGRDAESVSDKFPYEIIKV